MYLHGSKWNMTRKRGRRPNFWRILALLTLIGAAFYVDRVVVPATPPLFIPTATPTRNPESFIAEADAFLEEGKLTQAIAAYEKAVRSDPYNVSIYLSLARAQMYTNQYEPALENAKNALVRNNANPLGHTLKGPWIIWKTIPKRRPPSNRLWNLTRTAPSLMPSMRRS